MFYYVKFCDRNFTYGALWMWLVSWLVFTSIEWSIDDVVYIWLSKFYFQFECAHFQKKNFKIFYFQIEFWNKFLMCKEHNASWSSNMFSVVTQLIHSQAQEDNGNPFSTDWPSTSTSFLCRRNKYSTVVCECMTIMAMTMTSCGCCHGYSMRLLTGWIGDGD